MNKSSKSTTNNPRFVCDNWDRPEVVIEGHGKGRSPVRKVKTKGTIVINEDVLMEKIATLLNRGYEVRIGSMSFDGCVHADAPVLWQDVHGLWGYGHSALRARIVQFFGSFLQ